MKKTLSILIMLFTVSSVSIAHKSDDPATGIAVLQSGSTFKLLYRGEQNTDVKVLIFNDQNQIVFSDKIKNVNGFMRPYNFSMLPEGNYRFELTDVNGPQIERITYSEAPKEKVAKLMRVPGFDEKVILFVPNRKVDTLTITIFDETETLLYTEEEKVTGDFAKVYNLKNYEGKFRFTVRDSKGHTASLIK